MKTHYVDNVMRRLESKPGEFWCTIGEHYTSIENKAKGAGYRCKPCHAAYIKVYRANNGRTVYYDALRVHVINALGGKCARCGYDDLRSLALDHIDDLGKYEREVLTGRMIYHRAEYFPEDYQVLCYNCNHIKLMENGTPRRPPDSWFKKREQFVRVQKFIEAREKRGLATIKRRL